MKPWKNSGQRKLAQPSAALVPSYSDKCLRIGIRAGDVFDMKLLKDKVSLALDIKNLQLERIYKKQKFSVEEIMDILKKFKKDMRRHDRQYPAFSP